MVGYVYCLTNEAIPKLVKIGKTARDPQIRAKEISASTGVPTPFVVAWAKKVPDMDKAESALHTSLAEYRLTRRREFFRCSSSDAAARAKSLPSFSAKLPKSAPTRSKRNNFDVPMGLAMTIVTLGIFSAGVTFDLEASTIATATAGSGLVLTAIFQSLPFIRAMKG